MASDVNRNEEPNLIRHYTKIFILRRFDRGATFVVTGRQLSRVVENMGGGLSLPVTTTVARWSKRRGINMYVYLNLM